MTGVAVETALELWATSSRKVKRRIGPLFQDRTVAALIRSGPRVSTSTRRRLTAGVKRSDISQSNRRSINRSSPLSPIQSPKLAWA
jgi:hypothetical protein